MAVFTEAELKSEVSVFDMLDNAIYLTNEETMIQPQLITVKESSRLKGYTVRFEDVANLAESMDVDYISAMQAIAECNQIDAQHLCVAIDEATLLESPKLKEELNNIVLNPVNENSLSYQYTTAVLEAFLEDQDSEFICNALLEADTLVSVLEAEDPKNISPGKYKDILRIAKQVVVDSARNSRNWLAQQITNLRNKHREMNRKLNQETYLSNEQKSLRQRIITKVANIIDMLASKLARMLASSKTSRGEDIIKDNLATDKYNSGAGTGIRASSSSDNVSNYEKEDDQKTYSFIRKHTKFNNRGPVIDAEFSPA